jgi:hypothetical protein
MLAAVAIALGIALGCAAGGSVRTLDSTTRVGSPILILALFVGQGLARGPLAERLGELTVPVWAACSVALLAVIVSTGLRRPGLAVVGIGVAANALVVLLNHGMPVVPPPGGSSEVVEAIAASEGFYVLADQRTYLPALGDVLPAVRGIASLGDMLLAVGVCAFLVYSMGPDRESDLPQRLRGEYCR